MADINLTEQQKQLVAGLFTQAEAEVAKIADAAKKQAAQDAINGIKTILADGIINDAEVGQLKENAKKIPGAESLNGWIDNPKDADEQKKLKDANLNPADPMQGFMMMIFSFIAQALGLDPKVFGLDQTAATPAAPAPTTGAGTAPTTAPVAEQDELAKLGINTNPTTSAEAEKQVTKIERKLGELATEKSKIKFEDIKDKQAAVDALLDTSSSPPTKPKSLSETYAEGAAKFYHDSAKANTLNGARINNRDYMSEEIGGSKYEIPIAYNSGGLGIGNILDYTITGKVDAYQNIDTEILALRKATKPSIDLDKQSDQLNEYGKHLAKEEVKANLASLGVEKFVTDPKNNIAVVQSTLTAKQAELASLSEKVDDSRKEYGEKLKEVERLKAIREVLTEKRGSSWFSSADEVRKDKARAAIDEQLAELEPELKKAEMAFKKDVKQFEDASIEVGKLEEQKRFLESPQFKALKETALANAAAQKRSDEIQKIIEQLAAALPELKTTVATLNAKEKEAAEKEAKAKEEAELQKALGGGESVSNAPSNSAPSYNGGTSSSPTPSNNTATQTENIGSGHPEVTEVLDRKTKKPRIEGGEKLYKLPNTFYLRESEWTKLQYLASDKGVPLDRLIHDVAFLDAFKNECIFEAKTKSTESTLRIGRHHQMVRFSNDKPEDEAIIVAPVDDPHVAGYINTARRDLRIKAAERDRELRAANQESAAARTDAMVERLEGRKEREEGNKHIYGEIVEKSIKGLKREQLLSEFSQLNSNLVSIATTAISLKSLMDSIDAAAAGANIDKSVEFKNHIDQLKAEADAKGLKGFEKELQKLGDALIGAATNDQKNGKNILTDTEVVDLKSKVKAAENALKEDGLDLLDKIKGLDNQLTPKGNKRPRSTPGQSGASNGLEFC